MKRKLFTQSAPARCSLSTRRSFTRRLVGEGGFFSPRTLVALFFCAATTCFIVIPAKSGLAFLHPQESSNASHLAAAGLTFEERVSYQRAIEDVYWRHRTWPRENSNPKPSLDAVISQAQ